ncbi:MAG: YdeI/OmpD-associated family protein [Ilumatobacteraceae bacterium]
MGGRFLISFNAETRKATGRTAGDEVEVRLDLDDAPRVVEISEDLATEFANDSVAAAAWVKLSFSNQRAHAESITGAKSDATRSKRVDRVNVTIGSMRTTVGPSGETVEFAGPMATGRSMTTRATATAAASMSAPPRSNW